MNSSASLSFTPGTSPRLRTLSIVGTRPELIRLSATLALLDRATEQRLVHTGQNYDFELNQIFVEELGIRSPGHYLDANTSTVASMVGDVIARLDPILRDFQPQAFCVLGDTNSALGAYAARRLGIPDGIHTS